MAISGTIAMIAPSIMANEEQKKAAREQRRAQEKSNAIERRRADIANTRERRAAAAQTMAMQAQNTSAMQTSGAASSAGLGANQVLSSQFGGAVGFSNTNLAAQSAISYTLQQGANRAARHTARANNWAAVGGVATQAAPMFIQK